MDLSDLLSYVSVASKFMAYGFWVRRNKKVIFRITNVGSGTSQKPGHHRSQLWGAEEASTGWEDGQAPRSAGPFGGHWHKRWNATLVCFDWFGCKYVWVECSDRDATISLQQTWLWNSGNEKSPTLVIEQQTLKMSSPDLKISVDASSELQLQWALQRRGLGLD